MRRASFWLCVIVAAAALPAPPVQAQKNEGMGLLGPIRASPQVQVGGSRSSRAPRASRRAPRPECKLANPSKETAIDAAICANPTLLRKDRRIARMFETLIQTADEAKAKQLKAGHDAWLEQRKTCDGTDVVACLGRLYDARVRELETLTAAAKPEGERAVRRRK